jgi:FYVE zinc finger
MTLGKFGLLGCSFVFILEHVHLIPFTRFLFDSSCCASRFTWASTSNSEAQEARDKHNCRSCGGLVCHPCSKKRLPIPSIGLTVAVRVCDRCYNDMGGVSATNSSVASSFLAVDDDEHHSSLDGHASSPARQNQDFPTSISDLDMGSKSKNDKTDDKRPERQREKRSIVVDELASRVRSSALTTCS